MNKEHLAVKVRITSYSLTLVSISVQPQPHSSHGLENKVEGMHFTMATVTISKVI